MIAAVYARKSTAQDDVAEAAKSVTRQVEGARAFITAKGWTLDEAHIYTDDGVSAALFAHRPDYQRMMRGAAAGAFDALVFFDLDCWVATVIKRWSPSTPSPTSASPCGILQPVARFNWTRLRIDSRPFSPRGKGCGASPGC
jgi:resolvase-like protein